MFSFTSRLSCTTLLSLSLLIPATFLNATNSVDIAITEYETAARSYNVESYEAACKNLLDAAKTAEAEDIYLCLRTALEVAPQRDHEKRFIAYLCSVSYPPFIFPFINTVTQGFSTRGDSKICAATNILARYQTYLMTAAAGVAACGTVATTIAAVAVKDFPKEIAATCALSTILLSTFAGLNWTSLHFNEAATKEKIAFDDLHKKLLRSLETLMLANQSSTVISFSVSA